jgi:hypothetical protein
MKSKKEILDTSKLVTQLREAINHGNPKDDLDYLISNAADTIVELEQLVAILADQVKRFEKREREQATT